jgi:hypothetical protein
MKSWPYCKESKSTDKVLNERPGNDGRLEWVLWHIRDFRIVDDCGFDSGYVGTEREGL